MELHPFLEEDIRPAPKWWYVLSAIGDSPSMRVGHSATFVSGQHSGESSRVYIIGGANPSQVFDEVWVLDLKTRSWDTVESPGFRGRYEHAAFCVSNHPGKIFVFGGATQEGSLNDVQSMDISTGMWSDVEVTGTSPAPRTHRSAAVIGAKVYFFSGGQNGSEPVADRSVHCLDTEAWVWTSLNPRGTAPKPRHGHLMVAAESSGETQERTCSSINSSVGGGGRSGGSKKDKRNGRSAPSDGGGNKNKDGANGTVSSNRIYVHGGMSGSTFFDDLHILDLDCCTWSLVRKKRTSPPPRAAHEGLMHQNQLLLFGGMSQAGALDDAYKFSPDGNSWTKLDFEGPAPPNRLDFAMCSIKLKVPVAGAVSASDALAELTDASVNTREVLERELKPGSASSRDSFSDSSSVDEALYTLEPGEASQGQGQQPTCNHSPGAATQAAGDGQKTETEDIDMLFIHGGMDTEGEIFDDTLVYLLSR